MIFLNEQTEDRLAFESLLSQSKQETLQHLSRIESPSTLTGAQFEQIVFDIMVSKAIGTPFEGKLRHTEDREFPDIVAAQFFGVEVSNEKRRLDFYRQ